MRNAPLTCQLALPEELEALNTDVRSTLRRSFALSNGLDADKVDAKLKDGVVD
jgi:hypothetical protein